MGWENYLRDAQVTTVVNTPLGLCNLQLMVYRSGNEELIEATVWQSEPYLGGSITSFCGSVFMRNMGGRYGIVRTKTNPRNNELWLQLEQIIANEISLNV